MPKINVYLPDDLAEAVKQTGVPVSAICQRALESSVKRVAAMRALTLSDLGEGPKLERFTERAKTALRLGIEAAHGEVGTEHLLHGLITEGTNLALQILRVMEIQPASLTVSLPDGEGSATRFTSAAANALELAVTEAITLGHNYIGCEHMLLGLVAEPEGDGGQVLRAAGVDMKSVRAAVTAATAGYAHLRAQASPLDALVKRIERLEERLR
ncbi:Clp protease N-terminal domain-containing protein [Actinocrispum sp. NPDC049592]|uniref:Clp protease N-terminal domain-containing protein n=1 Tax=Actinocrispum sp. NPDC049592 TaxID=3154835 RepID=UPI003413638D